MKKVIYYNNTTFDPISEMVCTDHLGRDKCFTTGLRMLHTLVGHDLAIVDRTETLDLGFNYSILDAIPTYDPSFTKTFEQIADERAREILDRATNESKTINLYWSGGIDSTVAIVAILKNATPTERDNVTVHYNGYSINEYPGFVEAHINPNFSSVDNFNFRIKGSLDVDNITVTGEIGDQLFGSNMAVLFHPSYPISGTWTEYKNGLNSNTDTSYLSLGWQSEIKRLMILKTNNDEQSTFVEDNWSEFVNWIQPQLDKAPFIINTTFDFLWWINFSLKYQDVQLRILADAGLTAAKMNDLNHFFNTPDFQQWAMQPANHENKIGNTWGSYKEDARQYILSYTSDVNYYNNKIKEGSLRYKAGDGQRGFCALLDTFEMIEFGQMNNNWKLFEGVYGTYLDDLY